MLPLENGIGSQRSGVEGHLLFTVYFFIFLNFFYHMLVLPTKKGNQNQNQNQKTPPITLAMNISSHRLFLARHSDQRYGEGFVFIPWGVESLLPTLLAH